MFASKQIDVIEIKTSDSNNSEFFINDHNSDILKQIVKVHKKIKNIAKIEATLASNLKKLNVSESVLSKIKKLEDELSVNLLPYAVDEKKIAEKKAMLKKIEDLLDQYLSL